MNKSFKTTNRVLSILLSVLLIVGMLPVGVFAAENKSEITSNIDADFTFKVGTPQEFTISTVAGENLGVMVVGTSSFNDKDAIEKLEYYEVKDGNWYEFDGNFGPSTGFQMSDATSKFRVTFKKEGVYSFKASIKDVEDGRILCSMDSDPFTVAGLTKSEITSDIGEKEFVVGQATEFTFSTVANDYAGTMVIGSSDFSDADAIEKLEYYEVKNDTWYELKGDFGPSSGFAMSDATSKFRVTFKTAGDYSFTAAMKYASGDNAGEVLCSTKEIGFHVKDVYSLTLPTSEYGTISVDKTGDKFTEGTKLTLSVEPDLKHYISSIKVNGTPVNVADPEEYSGELVMNSDTTVEVEFVQIYSINVDYNSDLGKVETNPECEAGKVSVTTGTEVDVTATPDATHRVSKIEINGKSEEFTDNTYNNSNPYSKKLTADKDYSVVVTFAPLVFNISVNSPENGSLKVTETPVNYGEDTVINITPAKGYTVASATVNGVDVSDELKEVEDSETKLTLAISDIKEDKNVEITFKEIENASMGDVVTNLDAALRTDESKCIFAKDTKVTLSTEEDGIRVSFTDGSVEGGKSAKKVTVSEDKVIKKIELRYDHSWHEVELTKNIEIVFDESKPVVTAKPEDANGNEYYNSDVEITVGAEDKGDYSGLSKVEYWVECDGEKTLEETEIYSYNPTAEIKSEIKDEKITISAADNNSDDVVVYIQATDRAGNKSEIKEIPLKINTTVPTVTVKFDDAQSDEATDKWYNFNRTATIVIDDRTGTFDSAAADSGIKFDDGSETAYTMSDWSDEGDTHTATVEFTAEGNYSWSYAYKNLADLDAQVTSTGDNVYEFSQDKTQPTGKVNANSSVWGTDGFNWEELLSTITFGLYSNKSVSSLVKDASDTLSGFQKAEYYVGESENALAESELIELYKQGKFSADAAVVDTDKAFAIYVRLVDNAGNVKYIGTNGIVYDVSVSTVEFELKDNPNGNSVYGVNQVKTYNVNNEDILGIKYGITVKDINDENSNAFSGIKKVTYKVTLDGKETQNGTLFTLEGNTRLDEWTGEVIINAEENNGKNVKLEVTVTDNADNTQSYSTSINEINLDTITATVDMVGDAVTMENGYGWYKGIRTAIIKITDRADDFDEKAALAGINIKAVNKAGTDISDSVEFGNWYNNGDTHKIEVKFKGSAVYSWDIEYTNKAGNTLAAENIDYGDSESPKAFTVDNQTPTGTVKVDKYLWNKLISVLTFGIYNKSALNVTTASDDEFSPVKTAYYVSEDKTALSKDALDGLYNNKDFTDELPEITAAGQYSVYTRVTDYAGNYIYVSSDGYVIDATQTELSITAMNEPQNGIYGIDDVDDDDGANAIKVCVAASETPGADDSYSGIKSITYAVKSTINNEVVTTDSGTLYSFDYTRDTGDNSNGGTLIITDVNKEQTVQKTNTVPEKADLCREWAGCIIVDADKNNSSNTVVSVTVTDNAGNEKTENIDLDIDVTAPEISVSYEGGSENIDGYYNDYRTATVVFTERDSHFEQDVAAGNIRITAKDAKGNDVKDAYTISWSSDVSTTDPNKNTHTATVRFTKDANYTFDIAEEGNGNVGYTDRAGNAAATFSDKFTIDKTQPTGKITVNNSGWTKFLSTITFGLYNKEKAEISISAADATSPASITYAIGTGEENEVSSLQFMDYTEAFEISSAEQFVIYARITDNAGNQITVNSDGFIVDPDQSGLTLTVTDAANGNGIYGVNEVKQYGSVKGVKVHVETKEDGEDYSGIKEIKYQVSANIDGKTEVTQSKVLYSFDYARDTGDNSNGGTLSVTEVTDGKESKTTKTGKYPTKDDLLKVWTGDIIVDAAKNNSSDVKVTVTVTDNAGNVTTQDIALNINVDTITADITVDGKAVTLENGYGWYNETRTATITIKDRASDFDAENATKGIKITGINKAGEEIVLSDRDVQFADEWANNGDLHTMTVAFAGDAVYSWTVEYTNKAGNSLASENINYGSSESPKSFTVDNNNPTGSVTVDNYSWIDKVVSFLTFGIYSKKPLEVFVTSADDISPVKVAYYVSEKDEVLSFEKLQALYTGSKFNDELPEITDPGQYAVYIRVTDYSGNYVYVSSDGYIIDPTQTTLSVTAIDEPNANGIYGKTEVAENNGVKVAISAKEAKSATDSYSGIRSITYTVKSKINGEVTTTDSGTLYSFDYTRDSGDNSNGGTLKVTDVNTEETETAGNVPAKSDLCREWSGFIVVDANKNNSCDTVVSVTVTDNAGNVKTESIDLDIDISDPEIAVSYSAGTPLNGNYYSAPRTATVVFTERQHHFDRAAAEKNIIITAEDANGADVKDAYTISWSSNTPTENPDKNTITATVRFLKDANYTFAIEEEGKENVGYSDRAGNTAAKFSDEFTVDTTRPTGTVTINTSEWSKLLNTITFGLYDQEKAKVSISADDKTSPVAIEYAISDGENDDVSALEFKKYTKAFSYTSNKQFDVYARITDNAGNQTIINSDGFIVDTVKTGLEVTAVDTANENGIYGIADLKQYKDVNGVKVHISANEDTEVYSGIKEIKYQVTAKLNGKTETTQSEVLYTFENSAPAKADLLTTWSGDIIVDAAKNNSSDVKVTATVTDNAGNVTEKSISLDIDTNTPSISVKFDNNEAINSKYFAKTRTATVTIVERDDHFNSEAATAGIEITAVNEKGEAVKKAYKIIGWTSAENGSNPDNATHTATIEFAKDANYTFAVSYTGKSGNANSAVQYADGTVAANDFCVDTAIPEEAEISVNDHVWSKILKVLSFGLYSNTTADVKVKAYDVTSPVKVEYYKTNDPIVKTSSVLDGLYADGKFDTYEKFTVKTDEQFVVYVRITDKAGNYRYISSDGYIVDTTAAKIQLTADEANANGVYNKNVNVAIAVEEEAPYSGIAKVEYWVTADGSETQRKVLYSFDYTREEGANVNNGKLTITDYATGKKVTETKTGNVPTQAQLKQTWAGNITVDSELNNSCNVTVYVGVTDNAGNYSETSTDLDIDITDPAIKVTYDDTYTEGAAKGYFTARTATVEITERTHHFDAVAALKGITITATDANGKAVENAYSISSWTTKEGETADAAVHTAKITYSKDANYTFDIEYTDKADNKNSEVNTGKQTAPYMFTVDATAPTGTITAKSENTDKSSREEMWSDLVDNLVFGFWSNKSIEITGTSDDATSPIMKVEYYKVEAENASDMQEALTAEELDEVTDWTEFDSVDVKANTQFVVYLKITDNAGNYTYISTNGLLVDDQHILLETLAPEISVTPEKPVNGIYSDDVKVSIKVTDPEVNGAYSGLKSVTYSVYDRDSETPDEPTQTGTLYTFTKVNPKQKDIKQTWEGEITVDCEKNNSNNIQIVIGATDNSGNYIDNSQSGSLNYCVIKIDTTSPVINISYDNNNADSGSYFNANRTATISVTERNFDADDVEITMTNTDGSVPTVSSWKKTKGTLNGDDTVYTAKITYSKDGDYTFDIDYTDEAGHKASSISYGKSVAAKKFTIDKTKPVVSVSYDNNNAVNGKYYQSGRVATIVIKEHNFSTGRVRASITATDNGAATSVPSVSGWTTSGDKHTATIRYPGDALYSFDIAYTDLAGNAAADYAEDSFYVDNTNPVVKFTDIEANSANGDVVKPVVTGTDTNFSELTYTLSGANNGTVKTVGSLSEITNGKTFSFSDFTRDQKTDDIYTLTATATDMAGRSTTERITFSVNRFGSVYSLSKSTKNLNNKYVQEAEDVVINEVNANKLSSIKITISKGTKSITLESGKDYKISVTGGNGQWYKYTYTIFKSNFADEGVYKITVYSKDEAGNEAQNTLDTKSTDVNFGVDKTAPTINVKDLESKETYAVESLLVHVAATDNLKLDKVVVVLDGKEYETWSDDKLKEIRDSGDDFTFSIAGDSTEAHTLKITATDAAGNEYTEEITGFHVTTNKWVNFYTNTPLFVGTIIGVILLIAFIIFLIVWKRKKDDEKGKEEI